MIYELRTYAVVPGKLADMVALSADVGRKIRGDDYGKLEGYWTTDIGPLNRLVHLWSYADLNERARLRAALGKNEAWKSQFIARLYPHLVSQETRILSAALPLKPPAERGHVYELRRYRAHVGRATEWLALFTAVMPVRERYSKNVGVWQSESGGLDEITHLWAYRDLNHRAEVRARALQDRSGPGSSRRRRRSSPRWSRRPSCRPRSRPWARGDHRAKAPRSLGISGRRP